MEPHVEQHQQPLPSLCAELIAQADSPAGILADNVPLKWPARERCCQAKHGVKCLAAGIKLRVPPVCCVTRGTARSHPPPSPFPVTACQAHPAWKLEWGNQSPSPPTPAVPLSH